MYPRKYKSTSLPFPPNFVPLHLSNPQCDAVPSSIFGMSVRRGARREGIDERGLISRRHYYINGKHALNVCLSYEWTQPLTFIDVYMYANAISDKRDSGDTIL